MVKGYNKTELNKGEKILITPDVAKKMLEKNNCNRKVSQRLISKYADDMKSGNWCQTHQGIAFDSKGNVVDGQHRLYAVIKSNTPVVFFVCYYNGEVSPLMLPLDRGKNRTFADLTGKSKITIAIANGIYSFVNSTDFLDTFQTVNICDKIDRFEENYKTVTGYSIGTDPKVISKDMKLSSIEKAVIFILSVTDKNHGYIKRYFMQNMTPSQEEYFEWREETGYFNGGRNSRVTASRVSYRLFTDDIFITPKQYDEMDRSGKELREKSLSFIKEFID